VLEFAGKTAVFLQRNTVKKRFNIEAKSPTSQKSTVTGSGKRNEN
jgi:hypothetical protein